MPACWRALALPGPAVPSRCRTRRGGEVLWRLLCTLGVFVCQRVTSGCLKGFGKSSADSFLMAGSREGGEPCLPFTIWSALGPSCVPWPAGRSLVPRGAVGLAWPRGGSLLCTVRGSRHGTLGGRGGRAPPGLSIFSPQPARGVSEACCSGLLLICLGPYEAPKAYLGRSLEIEAGGGREEGSERGPASWWKALRWLRGCEGCLCSPPRPTQTPHSSSSCFQIFREALGV